MFDMVFVCFFFLVLFQFVGCVVCLNSLSWWHCILCDFPFKQTYLAHAAPKESITDWAIETPTHTQKTTDLHSEKFNIDHFKRNILSNLILLMGNIWISNDNETFPISVRWIINIVHSTFSLVVVSVNYYIDFLICCFEWHRVLFFLCFIRYSLNM